MSTIKNDTTMPTTTLSTDARMTVLNTWNGGNGGIVECFTSRKSGNAGELECMTWIHKNTSFSYSEAITNQGYKVVPFTGTRNLDPVGFVDPDDLEVYCSDCAGDVDFPDKFYADSLYVECYECFSCGEKLV